jgi:hypothetical protein
VNANYSKIIPLALLMIMQCVFLLHGQKFKEEKFYTNNDKHWLVEIPIWIPGFRGQLAYGDFISSSSGNREEREFEHLAKSASLEFYFAGKVMSQFNKLWLLADAYSGKVGSTFTYIPTDGKNQKNLVHITVQGTIPRFFIGYAVWEKSIENNFRMKIIPYLGLRYVNIHLQSDMFDSLNVIDLQPEWVEPLIGFYLPLEYKRFKVELLADLGGTETKNSFVINNCFRYRISRLVDIQLGWTFMKIKHIGNIDSEELDLMIRLFGPSAGVGFRF